MYQTYQFAITPFQAPTTAVRPLQTQISDLLNQIFPIITLMLVMGLIMPMMKSFGKGFGGAS